MGWDMGLKYGRKQCVVAVMPNRLSCLCPVGHRDSKGEHSEEGYSIALCLYAMCLPEESLLNQRQIKLDF